MITLIGTSTTTIGFGLCGIKDIHEIRRSTKEEDVLRLISESKNEVVMIDEDIFEKVKAKAEKLDKTFIVIPFRYRKEENSEEIENIVQDTLGIKMKSG